MRRRRDDPDQMLFRWLWSDEADDRPDDDADEDRPGPLAARVRARHGPRVVLLWGAPVVVARSPERSGDRLSPERKAVGLKPG